MVARSTPVGIKPDWGSRGTQPQGDPGPKPAPNHGPVAVRTKETGMQPATITTEAGHTWWRCPNCTRRLGEIVGGRLVVRAGDAMISLPVKAEPDQTCPRCGAASVLAFDIQAA